MFTGLVETTGIWRRTSGRKPSARAVIETALGRGGEPLVLGESVSVDGACLTVDRILENGFEADLSAETLAKTTLGGLAPGAKVHLERATPLGGRMGGHTVLGHVDAVGRVSERKPVGDAVLLAVRAPAELARYLAPKGSVALNGVSLTLNTVVDPAEGRGDVTVEVMLVPHTLQRTSLGALGPNASVNIEVDVLARYVARGLEVSGQRGRASGPSGGETDPHHDDDERLLGKLRSGGWT
jgi:riboflavin synthase